MSGDALRKLCTEGNAETLGRYLKDRANPCSQDEYGLTALHYAVWNGHIDCVRYLVANPRGTNKNGEKDSCINIVSCKWWSPLHITALDCPAWSVKEITLLLLMFGADQSLMDKMGKTAKDLAIESENVGYLNALDMFENLAEDAMITGEKKRLQATVNRKYTFEIIPRCTGEGLVPPDDLMPVHEPNLERKAVMPRHMDVYEDELKPMLDESEPLYGVDALKCLQFTSKQANLNLQRREDVLATVDPTWDPPKTLGLNSKFRK